MAPTVNLKSMSLDRLSKLKSQVESALASKIAERRRMLENELAHISRVGGSARGHRASVAPKYRNPDNPSETWAGRGLKPRWLTAAIKAGKSLDHFAIAAPAKTTAVRKSQKKARRGKRAKK
jgi:DNA-binding protein H-NS